MARLSALLGATALATIMISATVVAPPPPKPPVGGNVTVPTVQLDLDLAPEQRWTAIVEPLRPKFAPLFAYINTQIPASVRPLADALMADLDKYFPAPYPDELRGVAKAANASLGDVVIANLFYELTSACTSIVACRSDGTCLHCRNLDYGLPGLQELTINVDFMRNGSVAYSGVTFAGYVGVLTGVRPGGWSVSVDERWTKNGTIWTNVFEALFSHGQSIGFFLRDTLDAEATYAGALAKVQSTHLISVIYIIMAGAGPNEAAVVTRDRDRAVDTWSIAPPAAFFRVETNYDHWRPVEHGDDRRSPANRRMNATTYEAVTADYMWDVLSDFPNLNSETVYTALMLPKAGSIRAVSRNNK